MNPIPVSDFLLITSKYGKVDGKSHFDSEEDLVHDIFPDRILFCTNFMELILVKTSSIKPENTLPLNFYNRLINHAQNVPFCV